MKIYQPNKQWSIVTGFVLAVAVVVLVAWTGNPQNSTGIANTQDTVPAKKRVKTTREPNDRDLDKELRQLDNAQESLEKLDTKDWDKMMQGVNESLKKIDFQKIQLETQQAIKQVDFDKIQRDVQESLKKIDFDKIQQQVNESLKQAMASIDMDQVNKQLKEAQVQVQKAMDNKDWQKEIEKASQFDTKKMQEEIEKAMKEVERARIDINLDKIDMKKSLSEGLAGLEKGKAELKSYQEMIYAMEKDGLLETKGDYTIEYKDGDLYINDKKQSKEVTDKYRRYFKTNKVKIRKEDDEFRIDGRDLHNYGDSDTHID